ncbi:MBL fold metallo-hydrolase [Marinilongibacter aquaticus]|uniref:MBL fold metallo-hydrolase n=1 Tax=Marinilongibacter aquaticus TaxID=2975157 RepID=UPI0021BD001E|nr:MBL fold metallo-hydrolase [Marinilongibacter aquaticus]UBM59886.1 MBL fold metallo-hydrolase [Marinilongibacter aquaticus]
MIILISCIAILVLGVFLFMQQASFGATAKGERLERIKASPNYKEGKFRNLEERPTLAEGHSMWGEGMDFLFKKHPRVSPTDPIPSVHTDLKSLPLEKDLAVWFGHSAIYFQLQGKRFLIDPTFSGKASPIPGSVEAFAGSNVYQAEDMPAIDYLLISHDHYDHLDYPTILALKGKVKKVICGLGGGAHFARWGYSPEQIVEKDWYETEILESGIKVHCEPTHHDAGRGFTRAQALWMSFLIESPDLKIYLNGDGGYDQYYKVIGEKYGPIDWAMIEDGQYNKAWQSVHKLPDEVIQATLDVQAKNMIPIHNSKFTLAKHPWDEPLKEVSRLSEGQPYKLATPMIGEVVFLKDSSQVFKKWWEGIN